MCGGIITDTNGVISAAPKTTGGYHHNEKCTWLIRFPVGQRVSIQFTSFRLEYTAGCQYDYLEVRDGDGIGSPIVGRFCGSIVPPPFISTGNTLNVTFVTDYSISFDGFSMRYTNAGPGISKHDLSPSLLNFISHTQRHDFQLLFYLAISITR